MQLDADILVLTECVDSLHLPGYDYIFKTTAIPANVLYEELNYTDYLQGETAIRVAIFSKYEAIQLFKVSDAHTSICVELNTAAGPLTIYATIIGTRFNKMPYAKNELDNCKADCLRIISQVDHLCLAGDLNTSFIESESYHEITNIKSREALAELCHQCRIELTTKNIPGNIDHILLPGSYASRVKKEPAVFIEKDILSDHMGILVELIDR